MYRIVDKASLKSHREHVRKGRMLQLNTNRFVSSKEAKGMFLRCHDPGEHENSLRSKDIAIGDNSMKNMDFDTLLLKLKDEFGRDVIFDYECGGVLVYVCPLLFLYMCPHITIYFYICVLILLSLLYMCPHITIITNMCPLILLYVVVSWCVCPHITLYMSSYYHMCPSYYYICVLILKSL